ncbi:hypothetical protein KZ843_06530 [Pseudomonas aeruginosa]|nr:hypothetical protein [Pseudomonas aeruginosa]MBW6122547.1 hypothetical protein [Pseudomonas aeruginosa]
MARQMTSEDLALLAQYKPAANVGQLYDTDDKFAEILWKAIPNFVYLAFCWMTVEQVRDLIVS